MKTIKLVPMDKMEGIAISAIITTGAIMLKKPSLMLLVPLMVCGSKVVISKCDEQKEN